MEEIIPKKQGKKSKRKLIKIGRREKKNRVDKDMALDCISENDMINEVEAQEEEMQRVEMPMRNIEENNLQLVVH